MLETIIDASINDALPSIHCLIPIGGGHPGHHPILDEYQNLKYAIDLMNRGDTILSMKARDQVRRRMNVTARHAIFHECTFSAA